MRLSIEDFKNTLIYIQMYNTCSGICAVLKTNGEINNTPYSCYVRDYVLSNLSYSNEFK